MPSFDYRGGALHAEDVPLDAIAAAHGTPTYVYSSAALVARYRAYVDAFAGTGALVCYALKANSNQAVIATFAREGAGADIVSGGELLRARKAGVAPQKIVFAGVGKSPDEMRLALAEGILQFNVESESELLCLSEVATSMGRIAPVALRVNPDVDAGTHAKITTGKAENKFGVDFVHAREIAGRAATLPGIALEGLAVHIGSQLTDIAPFRAAFARLGALARELIGAGIRLKRLDFGGGVGVVYRDETPPDLQAYAAAVRDAVAGLDVAIVLEPGRHLVAEAGILLARVVYVKRGKAKRFVVVDAAMNDLIRPTLYEAWMPVRTVREQHAGAAFTPADIVGPICETGDYLARDRALPELAEGELIAIGGAGAYGAVMASNYNSRPLVAEVLVRGREVAVVRPRQDINAVIDADRLAPWLAG
jgi:diaminopimelate decarboxylase